MKLFLTLVICAVVLIAYSLIEKRLNQQGCPVCGYRLSADAVNQACPRCAHQFVGERLTPRLADDRHATFS